MAIATPCSASVQTMAKALETRSAERLKEAQDEAASIFARCIEDTPDLQEIIVVGWTPAWNDGDECTHHQDDPYLNGYDRYGKKARKLFKDQLDFGEEGGFSPAFESVHEVIAQMERLLSEAFDTNFAIRARRTPEGVDVEVVEYDCGR